MIVNMHRTKNLTVSYPVLQNNGDHVVGHYCHFTFVIFSTFEHILQFCTGFLTFFGILLMIYGCACGWDIILRLISFIFLTCELCLWPQTFSSPMCSCL